jgi:hypothetical protein
MSSPETSREPSVATDEVSTSSSSGNAFSVNRASGKFSSPRGQDRLRQKPRMYCSALISWLRLKASPNAAIIRLKPRAGPPSCAEAYQSSCGSRVAKLQSVKSGRGTSNFTRLCGAPLPSAPWQAEQCAA